MNWYIQAYQKRYEYTGRSRRSEFWYFTLASALVMMGIILIDMNKDSFHILSALYTLGFLIPFTALTSRRLHDTGRSGWTVLYALIPVVGAIILVIYLSQDSQPGENRYGKWPKGGIG